MNWPIKISFRLFLFGFLVLKTDACTTADGRQGVCISILECSPLYRAFEKRPLTAQVIGFLRKSACGFTGNVPLVCCNDNIDVSAIGQDRPRPPTEAEPPSPPVEAGSANELPLYPNCGNDASDRIYGGTITDLDEYPWMALLGYTGLNGTVRFECGGVLINKRYVLTAAHCVVGAINTKVGRISIARLGEYDTTTAVDCDAYGDCAPPHQDINVEQKTAHPGFTDEKVNREDDIALIRLKRDVRVSGFIKPICLPTELPNIEAGDNLVVAGWGKQLSGRKSNVKLKLNIPVFDKSKCAAKYAAHKAFLTDKQLCAGGKFAEGSCYGDSGGPLMRINGPSWETVAIVSFGNGCGGDGWPGVYTDLYKYLPWIKQNLRP